MKYDRVAWVGTDASVGIFSGEVVCPAERLTIQEALRTYTIMAARYVFMENRIGSLEPGKYADIVVWDRDLYCAHSRAQGDQGRENHPRRKTRLRGLTEVTCEASVGAP